jgi:acetylglutamate kinase
VIVKRLVLKVGGSELDRPGFVDELIEALQELCARNEIVLVHGGGKAIARLQEQLRLEPRFVEGLRVTDDPSLDVAEMVLSGLVNKRLVAKMVNAGIPALGMSGVDAGILRVVKLTHTNHDLGWVGEIKATNHSTIETLLAAHITPVISPISLGIDGHTYNVNADHAAAALSCALQADELTFVTNVPGVLPEQGGECFPALSVQEVKSLIASNTISGGMVPKVRSALTALEQGVASVRITDLAGLATEGGTCFHSQ